VVKVPVLSEQSTVMDAISCKAVKWVTMALWSAILRAPMAIVICMTMGKATGTEAITRDSAIKITWSKLLPRTMLEKVWMRDKERDKDTYMVCDRKRRHNERKMETTILNNFEDKKQEK